nr:hypothetical protein [Escherichia coli]
MTVFEYLQAHPNATSAEIAKGLNKKNSFDRWFVIATLYHWQDREVWCSQGHSNIPC